ncbi:MAG: hypothetical protein IT393_05905 [Nitrospirae bacterium]|nr:hypothetical protein [Nitrospirota bacterium]
MATTHTLPHGVYGNHTEVQSKDFDWQGAERRHLWIVFNSIGIAISVAMLVGSYFLLW